MAAAASPSQVFFDLDGVGVCLPRAALLHAPNTPFAALASVTTVDQPHRFPPDLELSIVALLFSYLKNPLSFVVPPFPIARRLLELAESTLYQIQTLSQLIHLKYPILRVPGLVPGTKILNSNPDPLAALWDDKTLIWRLDESGIIEEFERKPPTHRTLKKRRLDGNGDGAAEAVDVISSWNLYQSRRRLTFRVSPDSEKEKLRVYDGEAIIGWISRGETGFLFNSWSAGPMLIHDPPATTPPIIHQYRFESQKEKEKKANKSQDGKKDLKKLPPRPPGGGSNGKGSNGDGAGVKV